MGWLEDVWAAVDADSPENDGNTGNRGTHAPKPQQTCGFEVFPNGDATVPANSDLGTVAKTAGTQKNQQSCGAQPDCSRVPGVPTIKQEPVEVFGAQPEQRRISLDKLWEGAVESEQGALAYERITGFPVISATRRPGYAPGAYLLPWAWHEIDRYLNDAADAGKSFEEGIEAALTAMPSVDRRDVEAQFDNVCFQ